MALALLIGKPWHQVSVALGLAAVTHLRQALPARPVKGITAVLVGPAAARPLRVEVAEALVLLVVMGLEAQSAATVEQVRLPLLREPLLPGHT